MTRYERPTPSKEHTMVWDQYMRPWALEGHMWKRVANISAATQWYKYAYGRNIEA